jgi:hypothetical protein
MQKMIEWLKTCFTDYYNHCLSNIQGNINLILEIRKGKFKNLKLTGSHWAGFQERQAFNT